MKFEVDTRGDRKRRRIESDAQTAQSFEYREVDPVNRIAQYSPKWRAEFYPLAGVTTPLEFPAAVSEQEAQSTADLVETDANPEHSTTLDKASNIPGSRTTEDQPLPPIDPLLNAISSLSCKALDTIWDSSSLRNADMASLPPLHAVEDVLSKLEVTFRNPGGLASTNISSAQSPVPIGQAPAAQSTLMIYCPLEGGEYVVDATVKELARRTGALTLVIDPAHIAAAEWGDYGEAAAGLETQYDLPYGLTMQERLARSRSRLKPQLKLEDTDDDAVCIWCSKILSSGKHKHCKLKRFTQLLLSSYPSRNHTHGSHTPEVTQISGKCPRIVYVRDFGISFLWASKLISALQAACVTLQASTDSIDPASTGPIAIVFGFSPSLISGSKVFSRSHRPRSGDSRVFNVSESSDSDSSDDENEDPRFSPCSEGSNIESFREKRLHRRIQQWQDDSLLIRELSPLRLKVTFSNSLSDSQDGPDKRGYLRSSIIMPSTRDKEAERMAREKRRKELNVLRTHLALAAAGAKIDPDTPSFEDAPGLDQLKAAWASDLVDTKVLAHVIDHAVTAASTGRAGVGGTCLISWNSLEEAWKSYLDFEDNRDAWTTSESRESRYGYGDQMSPTGFPNDPSSANAPSTHSPIVIQSRQMTSSDVFRCLVEHGCEDFRPLINPEKFSSCRVAEGGFGDIWRGQLYDKTDVAIKVLRFALLAEGEGKTLKRTMREIYTWSKLDHKNVHKLLGVTIFQDRLGMVSKWMTNGNLRDYLQFDRTKDLDRYDLCTQIAQGVEYIHSEDVVHGDLKASNILVSSDGVIKLTDFDYSLISGSSLLFTDTTRVGGGTYRWMAPELVIGVSHERSKQADVYALGMTILEVISGVPPYYPQCTNDAQVLLKVAQKHIPERSLGYFPNDQQGNGMWQLLTRCWNYDPALRPTAQVALASMAACSHFGNRVEEP